MGEVIPTWRQPSHPDSIKVVKGTKPYQARAVSLVSLPAGAFFCKISNTQAAPKDTYSSVRISATSIVELCSDLVYMNHSCSPNLVFDVTKLEIRVADNKSLSIGDDLTFFYPSTEWEMAQPFRCHCSAAKGQCLGTITGASSIESSILKKYWLNEYIKHSAEKQASLH